LLQVVASDGEVDKQTITQRALAAELMKIHVFWDVKPYRTVNIYTLSYSRQGVMSQEI